MLAEIPVHIRGSEASSDPVCTGSQPPPALFNSIRPYYSSSTPLQHFD